MSQEERRTSHRSVVMIVEEEDLPRKRKKNGLHDALEQGRFEDASRLITIETEAFLLESYEHHSDDVVRSYQTSLHIIARIRNESVAVKLCRELLGRLCNSELLTAFLNAKAVDKFEELGQPLVAVAAIHIAAYYDNVGVLKVLCDNGVDLNRSMSEWLIQVPTRNVSALDWAATNGKLNAVRTMIELGADVNVRDSTDNTPLGSAACFGHKDVAQLLVEKNALVDGWPRHSGGTPLYTAAHGGHLEIVKLLLTNKAGVNSTNSLTSNTALDTAAEKGHVDIVKLLLAYGAEIDARYHDGTTALYSAAYNGHVEVVRTLLAAKADVNIGRFDECSTPLYTAAFQGHAEIVKLLLSHKADVNLQRSDDGTSALHAAAYRGHLEVAKLLVENNADINAKCKEGGGRPFRRH